MSRMINIQMDSDDMIQALVDRVGAWTDDSNVIDLFEQYYEYAVDNGCFDGCEFDVRAIVDNDYVNNTSIIDREEFDKDREEYIKEQVDSDGFSDEDRPTVEGYAEDYNCEYTRLEDGSLKLTDPDDQEDFEQELANFDREKQEALEQYENETPTWEDVEDSRDIPDFLDVEYIEAVTDNLMLVIY